MYRKKELLVIILVQVAITLLLTAAKPDPEISGPTYIKVAANTSLLQR